MKFLVRASYLQIYNEVISDLLKPERTNLVIREDKRKGVFVEGLSEWVVRSPAEIYGLMERGGSVRATGATKMNEFSSRSHAIFIIIVEQCETVGEGTDVTQSVKIGKLNLVDLAGSERVRITGATGVRLEESKKINQSLSALGNVIAALTDAKPRVHIPYRDSKLTRILEDSLGGNCKTTMMAMVTPALECFLETLSTLKFANRAKNIKNEAFVNEDLDQKALLRKYERELRKLRAELATKSQNVVDKRKLLEVEDERRRAEADKLEAIRALEARSREFMAEKMAKRKLEDRISTMKSQLLTGGSQVEDTPAFRRAIQDEQRKIQEEYQHRVAELERERQTIETDKQQVDRYKVLLLKQRDIMIALTSRLNERDANILALQEELDAYDLNSKKMEDALDRKTARLIQLERMVMDHNASSPTKIKDLEQFMDNAGGSVDGSGGDLGASMSTAASSSSGGGTRKFRPHGDQVVFTNGKSGAQQLLTAEEKVRELEGLLEGLTSGDNDLARELEEVKAEKVSLEYLLREKLEKMVHSEIEDRLNKYKSEVELLKQTQTKTEQLLSMAKMQTNDPELHAKLVGIIQAETEMVQKPYREKLSRLQSELEQKDTELSRLRRAGGSGDDVFQLRNEVKTLRAKLAQAARAGAGAQDDDQVRALEARIGDMQRSHAQFRTEVAAKLEQKNEALRRLNAELEDRSTRGRSHSEADAPAGESAEELSTLRRQISTHAKERAALQTIMEKKIKVLVEAIAAKTDRESAPRELGTLQKLVTASITAMRSSEVAPRS